MPTTSIHFAWDASYQLTSVANPQRLLILLHGFQQTGSDIMRILRLELPPHTAVLAPDAPFPIPQKQAGGYRPAFSWYFFDPANEHYLHDMSLACRYLSALVTELGLTHLPTCIAGFSQGGYLAPHAGLQLPNTQQIIGINCRFRSEALMQKLPFLIDGINGEQDLIVDAKRARGCHEELISRGNQGVYRLIPGAGHGLSANIRSNVEALLFRDANPR